MIWVMAAICAGYAVWLLRLLLAWKAIELSESQSSQKFISIIIPVRNEEQNIESLLHQLDKQQYDQTLYEVIVVNDHSEDHTVDIVQKCIVDLAIKISFFNQNESEQGKKAAITKGVENAQGELILTTDGDCQVGQRWIEAMTQCFGNKEVNLAFGGVALEGSRFFSRLQSIDFAALIGVGAASWKLGKPNMCNGANLAFRKETFDEVNGYIGNATYPSGDDEFLMRKIYAQDKEAVQFVKSPEALVKTKTQPDLPSFIQQRIRWAGKWRLHKDKSTKIGAIGVFLFYLLWLGISLFYLVRNNNIELVGLLWGVKWLSDVVFVSSIMKQYELPMKILDTLWLSLLYPFYAIGIGLRTISYRFEWKGRKYSTR